MQDHQDAYGHALLDYHTRQSGFEIVERDDGWIGPTQGPAAYFAEFEAWPPHQQHAMDLVQGRVLDLGCGAGRVALHLQSKGYAVTAVDISPLAVAVCRRRGVTDARVRAITRLSSRLGRFDTLIMLGNNFGLFGSPRRAVWLLRRFYHMTSPTACIIAESNDPYQTDQADHLSYHRFNQQRGRMSGQLRIRVRYGKYTTPWFDYLLVSRDEMQAILAGTGWKVARFIDSDRSVYIAILVKTGG